MLERRSPSGCALNKSEEETFGTEFVGMASDEAGNSCQRIEFREDGMRGGGTEATRHRKRAVASALSSGIGSFYLFLVVYFK